MTNTEAKKQAREKLAAIEKRLQLNWLIDVNAGGDSHIGIEGYIGAADLRMLADILDELDEKQPLPPQPSPAVVEILEAMAIAYERHGTDVREYWSKVIHAAAA